MDSLLIQNNLYKRKIMKLNYNKLDICLLYIDLLYNLINE